MIKTITPPKKAHQLSCFKSDNLFNSKQASVWTETKSYNDEDKKFINEKTNIPSTNENAVQNTSYDESGYLKLRNMIEL